MLILQQRTSLSKCLPPKKSLLENVWKKNVKKVCLHTTLLQRVLLLIIHVVWHSTMNIVANIFIWEAQNQNSLFFHVVDVFTGMKKYDMFWSFATEIAPDLFSFMRGSSKILIYALSMSIYAVAYKWGRKLQGLLFCFSLHQ